MADSTLRAALALVQHLDKSELTRLRTAISLRMTELTHGPPPCGYSEGHLHKPHCPLCDKEI